MHRKLQWQIEYAGFIFYFSSSPEQKHDIFLQVLCSGSFRTHFFSLSLHITLWHSPSVFHLETSSWADLGCFSVSLASPWPLSLFSSIFVSLYLRELKSLCGSGFQLRNQWVTEPLTVITDQFPSHHLPPWPHFSQLQGRELYFCGSWSKRL